jgi:CheY-like chemotaxis protein
MVRGIIKRHAGNMEIISDIGKGTTVIMQFPVPIDTPEETDTTDREEAPLSPLRVLVIDDEERARELLSRLLVLDGHDVVTASSGHEGLDMFRSGGFDLVITDRAMPVMSGDDVAAKIAAIEPDIPIIMLTGFGDIMKDSGECPEGVSRVMSKPVTRDDLRHVMRHIMP